MYYEDPIREAARRAEHAVQQAMAAYSDHTADYEKSITGGLAIALRNALNDQIEGLFWSAHILRDSSGSGSEETQVGADLLIHVMFESPELSYSKGVLIQTKRVEPNRQMDAHSYAELVDQCGKMLAITPASFVFDYAKIGMRCGAASAIVGSNNSELYAQCVWTPYRFFFELFRCPVGDPNITSARVQDLPVPNKLALRALGRGERRLRR